MNPTPDSRIFETQWFVEPNSPLIENKIYYAKAGNLLYYITTHRGLTTDNLAASPEKVKAVILNETTELKDTSIDCFHELQKVLDKPVR